MRTPDGPVTGVPTAASVLSFSLQGDGALELSMVLKEPGPELDLAVGHTRLALDTVPGGDPLPPYARLLHDVLLGDRSLFTRPDGLAHVWEVATPLLDARPPVQPYAPAPWVLRRPTRWPSPDGGCCGADRAPPS